MKKILFLISIALLLSGCESCSRSGRQRMIENHKNGAYSKVEQRKDNTSSGPNSVKMIKRDGVYFIPIKVNGVEMEFIFDTGASDIVISAIEAAYLAKQGKLSEDDIIGAQLYQIADGNVVEGIQIILREVEIANKTLYDVRASIMINIEAPLLLGQSALSKYGKISIDYNNETIKFE